MSSKINVSVLFVLVALTYLSCVSAKPGKAMHPPGEGGKIPPIKCAGTDLKFPTKTLDILHSCLNKTMVSVKEAKEGNKDVNIRAQKECQWVCVAQELGILDTSGKLVQDQMNSVVEKMFPEAKVESIVNDFGTCVSDYGSNFMLKEGDCSSYGDFIECGIKNIFKACDIEMPNFISKS